VIAITHHQPPAAFVALGSELGDTSIYLGGQRFGPAPATLKRVRDRRRGG
jgi:hypothetical protein